jgi:2-C-methyl-D-erythritol 4-phosphate cytidylyltransferase
MGGTDKVMVPLLGRPLVAHSLQVLHDSPHVASIVLVMSPKNMGDGRRLVEQSGWHKVREVCSGGKRRQDSVRVGLDRIRDTDWTVVHDAARPCISLEMLARGVATALVTGAAVAAVPVKDTIKSAGPDMTVTETVDRRGLWAVQTPQVFQTELLYRAHQQVSEDVTDDASMVEHLGRPVKIFMGAYENIKVTTPGDVVIVEAFLRARLQKETAPRG